MYARAAGFFAKNATTQLRKAEAFSVVAQTATVTFAEYYNFTTNTPTSKNTDQTPSYTPKR